MAKEIDVSASGIDSAGKRAMPIPGTCSMCGSASSIRSRASFSMSQMYAEWAAYLYPFNLTGNPALSVPCGFTTAGCPSGCNWSAPTMTSKG